MTKFELGEAQSAPALGGADQRAEHEFQHRLLAEAVGNDLQAPALLDEQPFEQVRRSRHAPIGDGQTEVGDARLEIVVKAGERARRDHGVVGADTARQLARDRSRRLLVAGSDARLELRPQIGRDLDGEVAHAVGQAALARRARKAFLDRPNDSRRAIGDDERGIA